MSIAEILAMADLVKNETGIGRNNAVRIGMALEEIIKYFRDNKILVSRENSGLATLEIRDDMCLWASIPESDDAISFEIINGELIATF